MKLAKALLVLIAPVLLTACSSTKTVQVAVPPRVDLSRYQTIGLVAFKSNANQDLERLSTQKFLEEVQAAQPGTRVVELGSEEELLASVGGRNWDAKTLRAVGEQHGVDAVVTGRLDMEKAKQKVQLSTMLKNLSASKEVNVALSTRLVETGTGATMWTDSARVTTDVAHVSLGAKGGSVGSRDPESVYGAMVNGLVCEVTQDFHETYVWRKVPKNQAVADVRD
jgi:hypothetical protein